MSTSHRIIDAKSYNKTPVVNKRTSQATVEKKSLPQDSARKSQSNSKVLLLRSSSKQDLSDTKLRNNVKINQVSSRESSSQRIKTATVKRDTTPTPAATKQIVYNKRNYEVVQVLVQLGEPAKKKGTNPLIKHARKLQRAFRRHKRRILI